MMIKTKVAEKRQGYIHLYSYIEFYCAFPCCSLRYHMKQTHRFPNVVISMEYEHREKNTVEFIGKLVHPHHSSCSG